MKTQHLSDPSPTRLWTPLLFGAVGLVAFLLLVRTTSPQVSVDLRLTHGQILDSAASFLRGLGYHLDGLAEDAWIVTDPAAHLFIQHRDGLVRANAMVRADSLTVYTWVVSWYNRKLATTQNPERFTVLMSTEGRVLRYNHEILDSVALPTLDAASARALAEQVLARYAPDFSSYTLKSSSDITLLHRVDHQFTFEKREDGFERTLFARVQGNEVAEVRSSVTLDRNFTALLSNQFTTAALMVTVSMVANFLLFFFVVILFLKKYHEGEVGTRTAVLVFLGYFSISVLYVLNQYPGLGATTQIGDLNKTYVRMITFFLWVFVLQMFLGVMAFSAWSVGESSSRSVWAGKMTSLDALLNRRFFSRNGSESLLRGYGWGFALLGLQSCFLLLWTHGGGTVNPLDLEGLAESYIPGLQPILFAFSTAMFGEIVTRLFVLSYVREKSRHVWIGVVLSVLVWCLMAIWSWGSPLAALAPPWNLCVLAVYGVLFIGLFLRYDLLTALAAHFVALAVSGALPLFFATGSAFVFERWLFVAGMAVPVVIGTVGFLRGKRFEFTPEIMPDHILKISERVRMAKELEIARNVQMSLLPKEHPSIEGYEISGLCIPAQEVGGDYFDFVKLGHRKLGIALGDVSGKGVPAAIYMTLTKGILQSNAEENVTPKTVLSKVNSLMYRTIERNSFVSMLYAVLDGEAATLRFARAGQCPILMTAGMQGQEKFLTTKGMALGLEGGETFNSVLEEVELRLRPGELLVFYTDGFTEAMNPGHEEFGEERLVESVRKHRSQSVDVFIQSIIDDVRAFAGNAPQHDDMTIVAVKALGGDA